MNDKRLISIMPVILAALIIISFMRLVSQHAFIIYVVFSFILCYFNFFLFDKMHIWKKMGVMCYAALLIFIFLFSAFLINLVTNKPINDIKLYVLFGIVDKEKECALCIATFLVLAFVISSFIYYYTMVIYRSAIVFMVILIPLMLYVKRNQKMPFALVCLLAIAYIIVMITCNHPSFNNKSTKYLKGGYLKNISAFAVVLAVILNFVPIPQETPFGNKTRYFLDHPYKDNGESGVGDDYSSSKRSYYTKDLSDILFEVSSPHQIYLKSRVYDIFDESSWKYCSNNDVMLGYKDWNDRFFYNDYGRFLSIVKDAFNQSESFAKKYTSEQLPKDVKTSASPQIDINVVCKSGSYKEIPNQTDMFKINHIDDRFAFRTYSSMLWNKEKKITSNSSFDFTAYDNSELFDNKNIISFISKFDNDKYKAFLSDLLDFCQDKLRVDDSGYISRCIYDNKTAQNYKTYTESTDNVSDRIKQTAKEITKGCSSDYEKTQKILLYFKTFTYDLTYKPPADNDTLDYFLFNSKKGICIDFASAMCILARESGLPARYVEGYIVNEPLDNGRFVVRNKDGHAYAEVYISGCGWMIFDPTAVVKVATTADDVIATVDAKIIANKLSYALSFINFKLVAGIILGLFIIFCLKGFIKEYIFRFSLVFCNKNIKIKRLFCHIRDILAVKYVEDAKSFTPNQVLEIINRSVTHDFRFLIDVFQQVCYDSQLVNNEQYKKAYNEYKKIYKSIKKSR